MNLYWFNKIVYESMIFSNIIYFLNAHLCSIKYIFLKMFFQFMWTSLCTKDHAWWQWCLYNGKAAVSAVSHYQHLGMFLKTMINSDNTQLKYLIYSLSYLQISRSNPAEARNVPSGWKFPQNISPWCPLNNIIGANKLDVRGGP